MKESWIQTYTGKQFRVFDPRPEDVAIEDIAHALSLICRFTGHCKKLWTVGQHSLLCMHMAPPALKQNMLLHDAAEAYLCDVARPVKQHPDFKLYRETEARLMKVIADALGIPWPQPERVHEIDNRALSVEATNLMHNLKLWDDMLLFTQQDQLYFDLIKNVRPEKVEEDFLYAYWRKCIP